MSQNPDGFDSLEEVAQAISTYQPIGNALERSMDSPRMFAWVPTASTTGTGIPNPGFAGGFPGT